MSREHILKCWTRYFDRVWDGSKPFEVRKNDREYDAGDLLVLRDFDPDTDTYSGREIHVRVTYVMRGGAFGIAPDHVVLGLSHDRQRKLAGANLPTCSVVIMTRAEFEALSEYSCTLPTGTAIGKRWRRREPYRDGPPGTVHTWWLGEYVDRSDVPAGSVGIQWSRIELAEVGHG